MIRKILTAFRLADWVAALALVLGLMYLCFPTSFFIRPVGSTPVSITGRMYTFVRETPFGDVDGQTWSEIQRTDGSGLECDSGEWAPNTYQWEPDNTIRQELGDWAWPCIDQGPPFYMRTLRRVVLFGFLPLRAMETETNVRGLIITNLPLGGLPPALDTPGLEEEVPE